MCPSNPSCKFHPDRPEVTETLRLILCCNLAFCFIEQLCKGLPFLPSSRGISSMNWSDPLFSHTFSPSHFSSLPYSFVQS